LIVYLDVVWLLNVFIDFLLLKLTAIVLKRNVRPWRLAAGTLFSSLIVLFLFTPLSPVFYHPVGKLVYSAIIVWIVFGYRRFSFFIKNFFMFYFTAFMLGGSLFAIHYFIQSSASYEAFLSFSTLRFGDPISWALVVIGFPVLWWFSRKRMEDVALRKWKTDGIFPVSIRFNDQTIEAKGLIDTGNGVNDPARQLPVVFVENKAALGVIPEPLITGDVISAVTTGQIPEAWVKRVSILPYRGVSGHSELTVAFRPDEVVIEHPEGRLSCQKVLVAFTNQKLSEEDDFNCILHPDLIQQGTALPAS